jgi:hypothetical protein
MRLPNQRKPSSQIQIFWHGDFCDYKFVSLQQLNQLRWTGLTAFYCAFADIDDNWAPIRKRQELCRALSEVSDGDCRLNSCFRRSSQRLPDMIRKQGDSHVSNSYEIKLTY